MRDEGNRKTQHKHKREDGKGKTEIEMMKVGFYLWSIPNVLALILFSKREGSRNFCVDGCDKTRGARESGTMGVVSRKNRLKIANLKQQ